MLLKVRVLWAVPGQCHEPHQPCIHGTADLQRNALLPREPRRLPLRQLLVTRRRPGDPSTETRRSRRPALSNYFHARACHLGASTRTHTGGVAPSATTNQVCPDPTAVVLLKAHDDVLCTTNDVRCTTNDVLCTTDDVLCTTDNVLGTSCDVSEADNAGSEEHAVPYNVHQAEAIDDRGILQECQENDEGVCPPEVRDDAESIPYTDSQPG